MERPLHTSAGGLVPGPKRTTSQSITTSGWTITTSKGPIMSDKDMDECRHDLGNVIALPEMLFNQSRLELRHVASGVVISFSALDALREGLQEGVPPLQVQAAEKWRRSREADIREQQAVMLHYDWTFTTPYAGTVSVTPPGPPSISTDAPASAMAAAAAPLATVPGLTVDGCSAAQTPAPWTYSSFSASTATGTNRTPPVLSTSVSPVGRPAADAGATAPATAAQAGVGAAGASDLPVHGTSGHAAAETILHEPSGIVSAAVWSPTEEQLDRSLLMERDPILFFDEVLLYESDLDDNGVCQLSAKLRVMPKCWFVLLRFWLRVDGCMVRLREARLLCRHDRPESGVVVLREIKHSEGTLAELRAAGAPDGGAAYADADTAGQVLSAVAPIGLKRFELHKLVVVPPP